MFGVGVKYLKIMYVCAGMILCLSGGGLNGLAYLGLFRYFESVGLSHNQFKIYGSSVGAMLGALWGMGFDSESLIKLFMTNPFIPDANLQKLIGSCGLDDGTKLEAILKSVISQKYDPKISLDEFPNIFICVCNISKKCVEYLSSTTAPKLPVYLAIRMSCNLPFIFTPVSFENSVYIDAAAMENVPLPPTYDDPVLFCKFECSDAHSPSPESQEHDTQQSLYIKNVFSLINQDRFQMLERFIPRIYPNSFILRLPKPFHTCNFWVDVPHMNAQIIGGLATAKKDQEFLQFVKNNR